MISMTDAAVVEIRRLMTERAGLIFSGQKISDSGLNITGKDADAALGRANITVNKNTVPGEPRSPFVPSRRT
mgnify:CR=1 FL=1